MEQRLQIPVNGSGEFSKYDCIVPLKDEKCETVAQAFKTISKQGRRPQCLWLTRGKNFIIEK